MRDDLKILENSMMSTFVSDLKYMQTMHRLYRLRSTNNQLQLKVTFANSDLLADVARHIRKQMVFHITLIKACCGYSLQINGGYFVRLRRGVENSHQFSVAYFNKLLDVIIDKLESLSLSSRNLTYSDI